LDGIFIFQIPCLLCLEILTMNSFVRFSLAIAALAVSSADAAAFQSATVVCLEDNDEICVGNAFFTTPSPAETCEDPDDPDTCTTVYEGGWTWEYSFIEGFDEGTDLTLEDPDDVAAAETGLTVSISLDDDESTCEIMVGNETCAECSAAECTGFNITYDCTNVEMGGMSMDCESLEPIFYPLDMFNETGNETGVEGTDDEVMGGGGGGADSGPYVSTAKALLAVFVAGAGFFAL
jgi:hypothetical protein